jgi:hypothetical protein
MGRTRRATAGVPAAPWHSLSLGRALFVLSAHSLHSRSPQFHDDLLRNITVIH